PLLRDRRVEETALTTFAGKSVLRVVSALPGDVPALRNRLESAGVSCFEADVRFAYRYLIDHDICGSFEVHGHAERHGRLGLVLRNPAIGACHWTPALRVLSLDIETDPNSEHVYSIALHTASFSRVLLVGHAVVPHAEPVHSEREL